MIRELAPLDVYYLVLAIRWTIALTLLALAGGSVIGLLVAAFGASSRTTLRYLAKSYVGLVQGLSASCWT